MKMIFLGPPAVGKGTHAGKVAKEFGIPIVSAGEMFREEVKSGTELGNKVKDYMDKGVLIPDELVVDVFKDRLARDDCKRGFILDGYPRTAGQADVLGEITEIDLVVNMVAAQETIIARISNRMTCKKCQAIYNTLFVKPKQEGVCDKCGGELYQRDDQKPDVVKERLSVYNKETAPLVEYYKKKGVLIDVSAEGEVDVVHKRVMGAIKDYFKEKT